tara:strand:- start:19 stop:138 length:120 start_codon:yes stop_codon:yes gene_type:complete
LKNNIPCHLLGFDKLYGGGDFAIRRLGVKITKPIEHTNI